MNQDSFVTAKQLIDAGLKPLLLNMANKISIGGGVEKGSLAQEETLFRCSNYHEALYPHGQLVSTGFHKNRMHYRHEIREFGSYYTPNIQVFRDSTKEYAFIEPFSVACIAMAGYDLGKPEKFEENLRNKKGVPLIGSDLLNAFQKFTEVKIRHLLEVAILHGHDSLVLGAMSCGAFRLPGDNTGATANCVALAYKEVLQEQCYRNRFKNISFAVLGRDPVGKLNYQIFQDMVKVLSPAPRPFVSPLVFSSEAQPALKSGMETKAKAEETQAMKDESEINELYRIFEKELLFFENLPKGTDQLKTKAAVKNILSDCVKFDKMFYQVFVNEVGVNGEAVLIDFKEKFNLAIAIKDANRMSAKP